MTTHPTAISARRRRPTEHDTLVHRGRRQERRDPMRDLAIALSVSIIAGLVGASDAAVVARRPFVPGSVADVGAGTPAAPGRSLGYAVSQTVAGGEVIVLDSAGYGAVVVTQAVTIAAPPGVYAGITVAIGNGV